jgi:hypothetical protein
MVRDAVATATDGARSLLVAALVVFDKEAVRRGT